MSTQEAIAEFSKSNPETARKIFEAHIDSLANPNERDDVRFLCEYFCNADFRTAVNDKVWQVNSARN